jgi:hypothetical protein
MIFFYKPSNFMKFKDYLMQDEIQERRVSLLIAMTESWWQWSALEFWYAVSFTDFNLVNCALCFLEFKWRLYFEFSQKSNLHMSHVFSLLPCFFRCTLSADWVANAFSQSLQTNGFSPVCERTWRTCTCFW